MESHSYFWEIDWEHNHYFLAFYGLLAYNIIEWSFTKDGYDKNSRKFSFRKYALKTYDNWIAGLALLPVVVWFGPDILNWINTLLGTSIEWRDAMYLGVGVLVQVIYYLVKRIRLHMSRNHR